MHFEDLPAFRMAGNFKKLFAELKLEKVFTTFSKLDAFEENSALSHQNANFFFANFTNCLHILSQLTLCEASVF